MATQTHAHAEEQTLEFSFKEGSSYANYVMSEEEIVNVIKETKEDMKGLTTKELHAISDAITENEKDEVVEEKFLCRCISVYNIKKLVKLACLCDRWSVVKLIIDSSGYIGNDLSNVGEIDKKGIFGKYDFKFILDLIKIACDCKKVDIVAEIFRTYLCHEPEMIKKVNDMLKDKHIDFSIEQIPVADPKREV